MGWGISAFAGGIAVALLVAMRLLKPANDVQKVKGARDRIRPWLLLAATSGLMVPLVDWVLGWGGWSLNGAFSGALNFFLSLGKNKPMSTKEALTLAGAVLGIVCFCYFVNLIWDTLRPKGKPNANTEAGAILLGLAPALFTAYGIVGSIQHSTGHGLMRGLSVVGAWFGGSI